MLPPWNRSRPGAVRTWGDGTGRRNDSRLPDGDLLLGRGFIVQAASERQNVLKVKPPLVLTERDARRFVDALDAVLGEVG